jgi:chorismate synthase
VRLRLHTAGESHGPAVGAILQGLPAGFAVSREAIQADLDRRRRGYGRGGRMRIESDTIEALAGLRGGRTLASPVLLCVRNTDWWSDAMDPWAPPAPGAERAVTRPRPGHADLAGALKLGTHDARDILERASARSTVARVAAGAVCKQVLLDLGVRLAGHVLSIGDVDGSPDRKDFAALCAEAEASPVRCADMSAAPRMVAAIQAAQRQGDSLGGVIEVLAVGVPPGLGSPAEWDTRLDGRLAQAVMSIQGIKGVEIGIGFLAARLPGSRVHDPIGYEQDRFVRASNHAGGIEGGMSNGEPVFVRAAMKPIPTLARPLPSVDLRTKAPADAAVERTDSCVVPAAAVVAEAAVAFVLLDALLEKTGGDSRAETLRNLHAYLEQVRAL